MRIVFTFLTLIFCALAMTWSIYGLVTEGIKSQDEIKSKLGKRILFDKDSVTIIDYNTFNEVYILSNGKEINFELIK